MTYAFGIYFEDDDNLGLVAAGSRWTSGGNSAAARRARVAKQRRDRYGRWADFGGGIAFPGRGSDNKIRKMVGRYVGPAEREGYMRVYVTESRGIRAGIYEVPCKVATVAKALLKEKDLKEAGVNLDVNGQRVGDVLDRDIEFIAGMFKGDPTPFELDMARGNTTKTEKKVIEKARLKAPVHKSYNIVNEKGVRVDKDEEPATPDVKPSKKAKPAEVFPIPDLSKLDDKERNRREWYVDANGKRIPKNKLTDADKTPENRRIRDLDNHRVLDGNGKLVEFKPEYKPEANPIPQGDFKPAVEPDDGFWNTNRVKPEEVKKDLTDPQAVYEELYNGGFVEVSPELALAAVDVAMNDLPFLGKDENPLFQSNPTDPRFREIANILASLPPAQESRLKRAINLALMSKEKIDALKAYLDSNIEEGIGLSPEAMKELHRKFRNLGVDITNMRISGQDAFSNDNLGAERINMPQLDAADQSDFLAYCDALGINYDEAVTTPEQLHPIQAEMDMGDVGKIKASWLDPALRKKFGMDDQYLFVTRDGYVLDGHHRWSSALLAQMQSGEPINLKVMVLDMDHEDALSFVNEYNDHVGITRQMVGGKNVAQARPDAPKAEEAKPAIPAQNVPNLTAPAGPQLAMRNAKGPDNTPLDDWLKRNLANKGDEILALYKDRLTADTPNPNPDHRDSPFPGSKKVVKNLIGYRNELFRALQEAALDNKPEEFMFKFEVAKRVTQMLNKIYDNLANGRDYKFDTDLATSSSNPAEKLKNLRIIPNTMVTIIDNFGKRKIVSFQAITIARNGAPFVYKWTNDGVSSYWLDKDGKIGKKAGHLGFSSGQSGYLNAEGVFTPSYAQVGSAFQDEDKTTKALGLMTGAINLTRWVQSAYGSDLHHSSGLYPPGNFYSKTVSKDMRQNHRDQADKAIHQNNPNGEIFKVMKDIGLIDGEYIPVTPGVALDDQSPGGYGGNSGGSGWLRRITINNTRGASSNLSRLVDYNRTVDSYLDASLRKWRALTPEEQQTYLPQIPEIFKPYFENPAHPTAAHDIQYNLLATVYTDGMSQDETVAFLQKIEDGLPAVSNLFGLANGAPDMRAIKRLKDAVAAHNWVDANNNYKRPRLVTPGMVRTMEQPFAGHFKFTAWEVPNGVERVLNDLPYNHGIRPDGVPASYTDNPAELQARFTQEELFGILRDSLTTKGGKIASVPADNNGNEAFDVDPNAVYKALENHGADAERMLGGIYDEINGNSANTDAIDAARADLGNLNDAISELRRDIGELQPPVAFDAIGGGFENGVLKSDLIKRGEENPDGTPALNLQPLNPVGFMSSSRAGLIELISSAPYVSQLPIRKFYIDGVTDNPKIIARNFSPDGLKNALIDAVTRGEVAVKLEFANQNTLDVSVTAIRDALQHQGIDINSILKNELGLKEAPTKLNSLGEVATNGQPFNGQPIRTRTTFIGIGESGDATKPHLHEVQNRVNGSGGENLPTGTLASYDLNVATNATDPTPLARIAKIVRNADGKYEVWVSSRANNRTEEFSGAPDAVYDEWPNAYADITQFIKNDMNLASGTANLGRHGRAISVSRDFIRVNTIDDVNPDSVEVDGISIERDGGLGSVKVYHNGGNGGARRIPGIVSLGNLTEISANEVYTVRLNEQAAPLSTVESFNKHNLGQDGRQVDRNIYSIINNDNGTFDVVYNSSSGNVVSYSVASVAQARTVARSLYAQDTGNLGATISGWDSGDDYRLAVVRDTAADNAIGEQVVTQDNQAIQTVSQITLNGGVKAEVVTSVMKGAHPAWRRGVPDADNVYTYATVTIRKPGSTSDNDVYYQITVDRIGLSRWAVVPKRQTSNFSSTVGVSFNNAGAFGGLNKQEAFNDLQSQLKQLHRNQDDKKLFGDVRLVNAPAAQENAPAPVDANAPQPTNFFGEDVFAGFVADRANPTDLSSADWDMIRQVAAGDREARRLSPLYIGGGASGALKITLPDGRVFKMKREGGENGGANAIINSERKSRQESLNHALYRVAGVQATEGLLGVDDQGQVVLADPFVGPIVNKKWDASIMGTKFTDPAYAQAVADLHEGIVLDHLMHQWDLASNPDNAFAVRDANGVIRGVRCDAGSGGIFEAIGVAEHGPNYGINRSGRAALTNALGDFMTTGVVSGANTPGKITRGLTKQSVIDIARRTILPLTDDKIDALVGGIITNDADRNKLTEALKRRRREILEYLQIDPNEQAPEGTAARQPANAPGMTPAAPAQLNVDGYEMGPVRSDGKAQVRVKGRLRSDGMFVAEDWSGLPSTIKNDIDAGELVPMNLPFLSKDVPADGLRRDADGNILETLPTFVDATGKVRQSPYGLTSLMIRRRKADGSYEYAYVTPGSADPTAKKLWGGKYAPMHMPKLYMGQPDPTPQEIMLQHLGVSVDPISTNIITTNILGAPGTHKILVADIGDQDLNFRNASRDGKIGDVTWRQASRLNTHADSYWNQFNDNGDMVVSLENLERLRPAAPGNQPTLDPQDGPDGGDGNGPSNPDSPQGGGPSGPRDSEGRRLIHQFYPADANGMVGGNQVDVHDYADGSIKATSNRGTVLGRIKPTYHGHWAATFMPDEITGRNGNNRNGSAVKGIFKTKEEADSWLAKKIYDTYSTPANDRRAVTGGEYNPDATPAFEVSRGFLNETTQDQRDLADRLIEHKVATSEERALYRAILAQDDLTVGEVGWVIGQLRGKEDRSTDEIEASRQAREESASAQPVAPSVMDNPGNVNETQAVRAGDLRVGQRIAGGVNGRVVFTAPGDNNTMNVGVVGDDGKLRVYKVGQNSIIAIDNQSPAPAQGNQNAPAVHPVIAQRRQTARLIQDRIRATYPNARLLPNGDLIVGHRDHRQANGQVFRYEAIVHKLQSDEFVSYVRKQQIDENGNPVGNGTAAYFTQPGHSPKAVLGRLSRSVMSVLNKQNPANGFNQRDDRDAEIISPATGLPIPSHLANANAQFIGDTGIEKTGNAAKDALISYVKTLVARGMANPEILDQVLGGNQNLFTGNQMNDIVERLEWNRQFPGVNAIPYVSKDNKTIVRVGDTVTHYDAFGNPILMANGQPRTGVVTERRPYTLNVKPNGEYEYTDQLYVRWANGTRPTQAAARRVEVNRRGDGSAPVPAVQGPGNADPNVENRIDPMPLPVSRNNVVDPPANADLDNFTGPNGAVYGIDRGVNMTKFNKPNGQLDEIFVVDRQNGFWEVRRQNSDGSTSLIGDYSNRGIAESMAKQKIRERDSQPVANNGDSEPNIEVLGQVNQVVNLPPNGRVDRPEMAEIVETLYDNEIPRNLYGVVRDDNGTKFVVRNGDNMGAEAFVTVVRTQDGWVTTDPRGPARDISSRILYRGDDRRVAEMRAINRMTGADGGQNPVTPDDEPIASDFRQERLGGKLYTFQTDSDGNINVRDDNGNNLYRIKRESEAPGGGQITWYVAQDANRNPVSGVNGSSSQSDVVESLRGYLTNRGFENQGNPSETPDQEPPRATSVRIGGKDFLHSRRADGSSEYYYNDNEVGRIERNAKGGYDSVDVFSGDVTSFNSEANAMTHQEALLDAYAFNGMFDSNDPPSDNGGDSSGGPSTPPPSGPDGGNGGNPPAPSTPPAPAPANGANPSLPASQIPFPRQVANGKMNVGGGVTPDDVRDVIPTPQQGATLVQFPSQSIGGDYNPGFYWSNPDGTVSKFDPARDGNAHRNAVPPQWSTPDNSGVRYRPGDKFDPNHRPASPVPAGPNGTPSGNGPVNPPTPPVTPAPDVAPEVPNAPKPAREARPRVNPVKPGDRRLNFNPGRDGKYWDVIDRKTRKVVGRAETREIAEQMALGLRDADGKLIDYNTPVQVNPRGPAKFPRPRGYKRTYIGRGQGYYIEKENDPNSPVVRANFDKDSNEWVGKLYANKQDAEAERNPIGEEVRDAGPVKFDGKANEALQKELDRLNPPAPAPAPAQPSVPQPQATAHIKTDLGSDMFSINDVNNEYGLAEKGSDGKWSIRVHNNPRDAMANRNTIATGTYDTPEEAEAAIRQAIADKRAAEQPQNMLQWQDGSDGKAYLGLDGVAGYDANESPVWGLSQMPFGAGWFVGAWNKQSDKDAGMPPVGTSRIDNEQDARKFAEDSRQAWIDRNPPKA